MRLLAVVLLGGGLEACVPDETVRGHGGGDRLWVLTEIDGTAFPARATLSFPERESLAGSGPCNRFSGVQTQPYPWFQAERVVSTRTSCPDLAAEAQYFTALSQMRFAEVGATVLILSGGDGAEMVFRADD